MRGAHFTSTTLLHPGVRAIANAGVVDELVEARLEEVACAKAVKPDPRREAHLSKPVSDKEEAKPAKTTGGNECVVPNTKFL